MRIADPRLFPALAIAVVCLAVPVASSAHTTISATQPQGELRTGERTSYVVRSPNESLSQNTFRVVVLVPREVQRLISVRHDSDWTTRLTRRSGRITRIRWTAKSKGDEIRPFEYYEWGVRFQNPLTPGRVCFGLKEYLRNKRGSRKNPDVVSYTGPPGSRLPASCLTFVE